MDQYMSRIAPAPLFRPQIGAMGQQLFDLSRFPVAMAYVPMQRWQQTYDLGLGFSRGTIFPDLDLPFEMGRCQ